MKKSRVAVSKKLFCNMKKSKQPDRISNSKRLLTLNINRLPNRMINSEAVRLICANFGDIFYHQTIKIDLIGIYPNRAVGD